MIRPSLTGGFLAIASVANLAAQTPDPNRWDVTQAHGRTRVVSFTTTEGTDMSVDISPDGRWILFDLLGHVYRVPATGGEAENLTRSSGVALNFQQAYNATNSPWLSLVRDCVLGDCAGLQKNNDQVTAVLSQ